MLVHADLKQASTYLNVTQAGLQEPMSKYGTGQPLQSVAIEPDKEPPPLRNDAAAGAPQVTVN